ncbi:MAG: serine/threonine protein kinase [Acidobacteria bacterium]|nr:serine/threonine protein kinase [Acidobacteriota bacterium]
MSDEQERATSSEIERERVLAAALAEYIDLCAESECVDAAEFCRRYPGLESALHEAITALDSLDKLIGYDEHESAGTGRAPVPERLSDHRIVGQIGAGGMARVYQGVDERLGRKVAIKVLDERFAENETIRTRFMQEARALARLSHPNIVQIYSLGQAGELPHFVMEYVEGAPLNEAAGPLPIPQKVELFRKIVMTVHFLHQHHIIHRDLKPGNILVTAGLEPKLLDFGLARDVEGMAKRLTLEGEIIGTPQYFSPEQARGEGPLGERSDIFTLGTVLYEMLTGVLPFRADDLHGQANSICEEEPVLPRRLNPAIPGELQNICMQALEKNPANRYASAREMADDLERFLAGEPVLAAPTSYARRMAGKIEQHLRELEDWRRDRILSNYEFDALRRNYDRLAEREDAWILEVRRLSLPQVALYFGAWLLVVAASLVFLFRYKYLSGTAAVAVVGAPTIPTFLYGIRCWTAGRLRIAVAYLLSACLLLPITLLVAMGEYGLFGGLTQGREDLEFIFRFESLKRTTNAQLWWALCLSLPAYVWLRKFTRSSVFSLVFAVIAALLCGVTLLRLGMLEWLEKDPGRLYLRLIPVAFLFFLTAISLERLRYPADSRYFYPIAVLFTYISLSGTAAFHEPWARWLEGIAPWTRGQVEYLFVINAGIYFLLQLACERFSSQQMRAVAKAFRFVIAGHVLVPVFLLGL